MSAADIPAVLPLVEQYWIFEDIAGYEPSRVRNELERLCADPRLGAGWIAEGRQENGSHSIKRGQSPFSFGKGDSSLGYLLAVYVFSLEHLGLTAEIDEFYVLPSARGQGAGRALLQAAEAEFVRMKCTNVSLQLGRGNDAAREYYRRRGYSERAGYELLDKMLS
jgi:ribosomal protein S18 acetylase RimI-like enzyme